MALFLVLAVFADFASARKFFKNQTFLESKHHGSKHKGNHNKHGSHKRKTTVAPVESTTEMPTTTV